MPLTSPLHLSLSGENKMIPYVFLIWIGSGACAGSDIQENPGVTEDPGPNSTLLVSQAVFGRGVGPDGKAKVELQPARLGLWTQTSGGWTEERIEDADSNVFHKAISFQDGILTLSGEAAKIKHWTKREGKWTGSEIWSKDWGGQFSRMRDVELADLDGDGSNELVVATHDMGVIGVGTRTGQSWAFQELGQKADTIVHEIEIGDLDGDGKPEIYATPSQRNRADLSAQPGGVVQYSFTEGKLNGTPIVEWSDTHAKEITVVKGNAGAPDTLYAVKEASKLQPVQVVRLS